MNTPFRIIAKLDIKDISIIKGINFEGMRKIGEAKKFAKYYFKENIDELIINDVNASLFSRNTALNFLKSSCEKIFIPITLQGGFRSLKNISDAINNQSIDEGRLKIDEKIRRSDVVFICTPVSLIDTIANKIYPYLSDHTIVTDVGSVKNCYSSKTLKLYKKKSFQ